MSLEHLPRVIPIPYHWIGVRKHWPDLCQTFGQALVTLPPRRLRTHALVVGGSGYGKTTLFHHLAAGDILRGHSMIALDSYGDFALAIIELAARGQVDPSKVLFFNLREKTNPLGFNPLAGNGEPYYRALGLIDAVATEYELGVQTAETFRNAALLLAETQSSLLQLDGLFHDARVRKSLIEKAKSKPLRDFWTRYDGLSSDKQAALASPVLNKVSALLSTEGLRRMYGHPMPADLAKQLNTPGSITVISLAADEVHAAGWMTGSILLSAICREIFSRATLAESERNPVRLYCDEFESFPMKIFELILSQGRRFGFSVVLGHQTLAQLTPTIRSVILGNVGVKVVFRSSYQDAEILNKDLAGIKGAFDIANLPVGEAILWRRGEWPFQIEVNAPLIDDVGLGSPLSRAFLYRLAELTPPYFEVVEAEVAHRETSPNPASGKRRDKGEPLEEWL